MENRSYGDEGSILILLASVMLKKYCRLLDYCVKVLLIIALWLVVFLTTLQRYQEGTITPETSLRPGSNRANTAKMQTL